MTKLFPNSPGNYYNHKPTSRYDQKTIIIIAPTRIDLKKKDEVIPNSPRNYHNYKPYQDRPQK